MQTHSDAPRSRPSQDQKTNNTQACQTCFRPKAQCLCGKITPISTETRVVILQHPQEKLKVWNSAMLTHLALRNSCVKVGFSWANLKKATASDGVPSNWAVLYLKSNQPLPLAFNLFNRKEEPLNDPSPIEGIVILDGSWKQAHALWWRNPWLLRLNRIALNLDKGSLRGQAKKSGLSSIESVAHCLPYLGEDPSTSQTLLALYKTHIVDPNLGARASDAGVGAREGVGVGEGVVAGEAVGVNEAVGVHDAVPPGEASAEKGSESSSKPPRT